MDGVTGGGQSLFMRPGPNSWVPLTFTPPGPTVHTSLPGGTSRNPARPVHALRQAPARTTLGWDEGH